MFSFDNTLRCAAVFMVKKRRREAALQAERDAPPGIKRAGSSVPFMYNGTAGTVGSQGSTGSGQDMRRGKDYFGASRAAALPINPPLFPVPSMFTNQCCERR